MCPTFQAEELLASLPKPEQVALIMEALGKYWKEEDRFGLLEALGRILQDAQVELRKQLMAFYASLHRPPEDASEKPLSGAFIRTVLAGILRGWDWKWEEGNIQKNPDAAECFLFFCDNLPDDELRDSMIQELRKHINSRNPGVDESRDAWFYTDLDEWILHPHFSEHRDHKDILEVLFHARTRIGGGEGLRSEMAFFASLGGPNLDYYLAPPGALALVQERVKQVKTTYELLGHIGNPIAPKELTGKPNPDGLLTPNDKVHWRWDTPNLVKVTITFGGSPNPEAVIKLRELSAELVRKSGLPIQIAVGEKKANKPG